MSKTIQGVPDYITNDEWGQMIRQYGFDPNLVIELRFAPNGVHALVLDQDEHGARYVVGHGDEFAKHRVFIPVRKDEGDGATTRVTKIKT